MLGTLLKTTLGVCLLAASLQGGSLSNPALSSQSSFDLGDSVLVPEPDALLGLYMEPSRDETYAGGPQPTVYRPMVLVVTPEPQIPEPGTFVLGALGIAGFAVARRRWLGRTH